jgi:predicted RNA methylase
MQLEGTKKYWSVAEGAYCCLIDKKRTNFFKRSIFNTVKKNDIVVDVGTGTGILALFAADAGAKKVYVVEIDKRCAATLKDNFTKNGYGDIIEVVYGNALDVRLPQKVDVIICEMISTGLIEELQIPVMSHILKFGKRNVKVFLNEYNSYIDLVSQNTNFYGHKLDIFRFDYPEIPETKSTPFTKKIEYLSVKFHKKNTKKKINKKIRLEVNKNGIINGIRISGKTVFFDKSVFSCSSAYSFPLILPIQDMKVKRGDRFNVNLSYTLCGAQGDVKYSISKVK